MDKRVAIFASGEGTNAEHIIQYFQKDPSIHVEMVENPVFGNIEYHGVPGSEITFWSEDEMLTSKSENVTVYISGSETGISVWFYIGTYADIANIWKL